MILLGLGSNIASVWGSPADTLIRTTAVLEAFGVPVVRQSDLFHTTPYGHVAQPDFVNAVLVVVTHLPPRALLARLHRIEREAGRRRARRWGPRCLDLDLLDYHGCIVGQHGKRAEASGSSRNLILPHPELHRRPFVLQPIHQVAPFWHHPRNGLTARQMLNRLGTVRGGLVTAITKGSGGRSKPGAK